MIYIFIGIIASIFAYLALHVKTVSVKRNIKMTSQQNQRQINKVFWILSFLSYFLPAALRYGVGQDYFYTYAPTFTWIHDGAINSLTHTPISYSETGFTLLNKVIAHFTDNYQWLFVITSLICMILVYKSIRDYSADIVLSVFMLLLGSFYLASYNFVRQSIAIAIFAFSLRYIERKQQGKYYISILIAISMHSISIVYLPFYFLSNLKLTKRQYAMIPVISIVGFRIISPLLVKIISLTRFSRNIVLNNDYNLLLTVAVLFVYYITLFGFSNHDDKRYTMYLNLLMIAACFIGLSTFTGATDRLIYAYYYTNFLTIPYIYRNAKWGKNRPLAVMFLIFILCILWGYEHLFYDQFSVLPYESIWSK